MTKKYGSKVKEIYNFGAPRLGNEQFAHFMNLKIPTIFRVTYSHDLAPHLPPTNFEYLHPASEVFYTDNFNKYKVCDSSGEDPSCSNQYYPHYTFADNHVYFVSMDSSLCWKMISHINQYILFILCFYAFVIIFLRIRSEFNWNGIYQVMTEIHSSLQNSRKKWLKALKLTKNLKSNDNLSNIKKFRTNYFQNSCK